MFDDTIIDNTLAYDYDIAGMRFLSGASIDRPYQRALSRVLRDQMDDSNSPGNNSLAGWWIRGQSDWSVGEGQIYQEPIEVPNVGRMYDSGAGVDPFTDRGFLTLLPKHKDMGSFVSTVAPCITYASGSPWISAGSKVYRYTGETATEITGVTGDVTTLIVAGAQVLAFTDQGVFAAPIAGATFTRLFKTTKGTIGGAYVKQRLLMWQGVNLYEEPVPTTEVDFDTLKAYYTSTDPTYRWVSAASAPQAIMVAGNGSAGSEIWAITLDSSGKIPDTAAPASIAEFPPNETLFDIDAYLGSFLGIATSKGVRVGLIDTRFGTMTYGPLIGSPVPQGRFSAFDRFLIYPVADAGEGRGGLVKVDLSEMDEQGRAGWATFLRTDKGVQIRGLVSMGERSAFMVGLSTEAVRVFHSNDAYGLDTGFIQGSWVRFGTLEKKNFTTLTVVCEPNRAGNVDVYVSDEREVNKKLGSMTTEQEATYKTGFTASMTDAAVRLVLTPGNGEGPKVNSWSLRALPTPYNRSEMVQLVLMNYDFEKDTHGVGIGFEGRAMARYEMLLELIRNGGTLHVQELNAGVEYDGVPEDMSFTQTSAPTVGSGFGGTITIVFRTVE